MSNEWQERYKLRTDRLKDDSVNATGSKRRYEFEKDMTADDYRLPRMSNNTHGSPGLYFVAARR